MDRAQRREKAIDQCDQSIRILRYVLTLLESPLIGLSQGTRLEHLEERLTVASVLVDAALHTCADAAHDPDCKEVDDA